MGCPEALSSSISASNSSTGCSASLLVLLVSSVSISTCSLPTPPAGAGSTSVSTSISSNCTRNLSLLGSTFSGLSIATLGEFSASNAALLRLHSALCRIPGATIPESHAGHLGVLGKTLTAGTESAGDVAGEVGTTEGDLGATAGVLGIAFAATGALAVG